MITPAKLKAMCENLLSALLGIIPHASAEGLQASLANTR